MEFLSEVYFFAYCVKEYERIQSDIFDHWLMVGKFDLFHQYSD